MYENLHDFEGPVEGFASVSYWSSSEKDSLIAWIQHFGTGNQSRNTKLYLNRVRAVRAF